MNNDDPWDPTAWDGDLDELKRRLSGLSIPHDLKCEIHVILQQAEPTRLDELLAFLVNTASQLTYAERQALVRLDLTKENDPEIRQLLQKYQISKVVLQQWKSTVQSAHTRVVQRDMISEGAAEEETASLYEPSSRSSQDSSQPTVTPRRTKQPPPKAPTKRAQTLTPMECEAVRQGVKAKRDHTNQQLQEAPKQADQAMVPTLPTKPVREAWPEQWQQMQSIWPSTASAPFPLEQSTEEEWILTARAEPTMLLHMIQRFAFPEELMASLSDKTLMEWTSQWRRDCVQASLIAYRSRSDDRGTLRWLDDWKARFARAPPNNLATLVDSSDDWVKLRSRGYGKDEVLKLCDVGNKRRLAQHLLCALIYEKEIRAITGRENENENGALTRLKRHLIALQEVDDFRKAYSTETTSVDWSALARYFSTALEKRVDERDHPY